MLFINVIKTLKQSLLAWVGWCHTWICTVPIKRLHLSILFFILVSLCLLIRARSGVTLIYMLRRTELRGSEWKRETVPKEKEGGERRDEYRAKQGKERGVGERKEDRWGRGCEALCLIAERKSIRGWGEFEVGPGRPNTQTKKHFYQAWGLLSGLFWHTAKRWTITKVRLRLSSKMNSFWLLRMCLCVHMYMLLYMCVCLISVRIQPWCLCDRILW